jgi:peptidoglycan/xylan/chitin deacetylase (PgdA/CDA1 family)
MKRLTQSVVRKLHSLCLDRGLRNQLSIYFHSLEASDYSAFRELVGFFVSSGYEFVDPDRFLEGAPSKRVMLSFDDNYRAWFEALALFQDLKIHATFYVNTGPLRERATPKEIGDYFDRICHHGQRIPLNSTELTEMARAGHTIGCHTRSHFRLTALSPERAQAEISSGKADLEQAIGKTVVHFSYPFGMRRHFNEDLRQYCQRIGLRTVAAAIPGMQHAAQSAASIHRSPWDLDKSLEYNLTNLRIDGSLYARLTGRSAVA